VNDAGTAPIRVVIADDQTVVRDGLRMLVSMMDGVQVVAVAADGEQAVRAAREHHPDVVLMDLRMPQLDGVGATRALAEQCPEVAVVVLTTYADDQSIFPALQAGARGYLTKDASSEQIEQAIRAVTAGQPYLDPVVQQRLVTAVMQGPAASTDGEPAHLDDLTPREVQVLQLIASGFSNTEIADQLFLSSATVKSHINRIFAKTGARDRSQAVRYAYSHGLVPRP
jgi:DNA-binding NarL/FixJ family response regulator